MSDSNAQYRNSLFCSYFNEPSRLLSLCNAVLGKNYSNSSELEITTLEGIFFDNRKNDISCRIRDNFLVLFEHQSTVNPNMPFRCLSYVAEPLKKIMRLSEAFDDSDSSLELIVTAFNINFALHSPILKKCSYLNDYSALVGEVKKGIAAGLARRDAIIRAVKICIDKGIMKGYLEKHSEEVFTMLALEWDFNEAMAARHDDGFDKGRISEKEAIATKMLHKDKSFDEIHELTDLPIERIKEISSKIRT